VSLSDAVPLVLVGAGKMGSALARGWMAGGMPADGLTLVDPAPAPDLEAFATAHGIALVTEPPASARVLVIAVKPQVIEAALATARRSVGSETLVLSIAAGVRVETIAEGLGTGRVVRTMPNTPAQIGKGITGAFPAPAVTAADRTVAEALLAAAGRVVWVDAESDLDIVTAVSGSGPAYVFYLVEALAAAGVAEGLDETTAMVLARQTVIGAAALMEADEAPAAQLRENVTSRGGTTAAALDILMAPDGLGPLMRRAIAAARQRSEELGG
jgi:pyrroline-5-carboxylate reductase